VSSSNFKHDIFFAGSHSGDIFHPFRVPASAGVVKGGKHKLKLEL
jgi:hypothetical protein